MCSAAATAAPAPAAASARLPFFAFENCLKLPPAELAATLKDLGYDGLSASGYEVAPLLRELHARGLKLYNTYLTPQFDDATNALTEPVRKLIDDLQGSGAALWIAPTKVTKAGQAFAKSSPDGDKVALARLKEIADYAEPRGVKIALYPHTWFWLERVEDGVRLADKLNRPGVGATFNLCHWLKVEGDRDPLPVLKSALPRLFFVSLNGADAGDTRKQDWNQLIQTLDQGSYDVAGFVRQLREIGYAGPVGLQCFNLKGDPKDNLTRSMAAWRKLEGAPSLPPRGPSASAANLFTFESHDGVLAISCGGQRVADYVYRDAKIPRPYFAHLHAPSGVQVSRNHPPVLGKDPTDHDVLHPGVWLAFADLSGQDSWRNLAAIKHERFTEPPAVRDGRLTFATESRMQTTNGQALCTLLARITLSARPAGYLLIWDATFVATEQDIAFGDQEEMGLGVRVATPITEKNGGLITTSTGGKTAKATWGKAFDWCDYSGVIGDRRAGVTLMPDPANFRPSWFHNRDYGLMVANPFGRQSMKQGDISRVEVKKGEKLCLRFGLLLHSAAPDKDMDVAAAYRDFLGQLPKPAR